MLHSRDSMFAPVDHMLDILVIEQFIYFRISLWKQLSTKGASKDACNTQRNKGYKCRPEIDQSGSLQG
jgi:hypothetical protein